MSIGCAVYPESGENVTDVMQYADMNLYRAKRNGRNLVAMDDQAEHPTSGHARR